MDSSNLKFVFYGAGAIGGSVAAWVASQHEPTYVLARGAAVEVLRSRGTTLYQAHEPDRRETVRVKVIDDLRKVPDADVVVIGVKLYSLEAAARQIHEAIGDHAIIVAMQNGVENQKILPHYFSRVLYAVVCYNAWVDEPGVIGYQQKGPLLLGTPNNSLQDELKTVAQVFNRGVATTITDRFQDAAHCKLMVNLGNSVTTLVGFHYREIKNMDCFQDVLVNIMYEGIQVLKAAGYHQVRLGGMPPWSVIWASTRLPRILTRSLFRSNLKRFTLSSMGQDVLQRKSTQTELEYLNGHMLSLADRYSCRVPYNRTIYRLCKERFSQPGFEPMDASDIWKEVQKEKEKIVCNGKI